MTNRLANQSSPYLLQHAENPVDWYPWSAEALQKSRQENKPIFLSIGYSACHWCHVMEHESFENAQIADFLNQNFVSIKVDREERPDLDQIYMAAVMAMLGHGGWPLSAFLTPDQDFFFGGTYWPPTSRAQMPGFDRVLASVLDAWTNKREEVVDQSKQITRMIQSASDSGPGPQSLDADLIETAIENLHERWDDTWGGFGSAPKFPHPMDLSLLLRMIRANRELAASAGDDPPDSSTLRESRMCEMVELTLRRMAMGGIHDHLAGGFARYSVDQQWLVPHFEKMLYDNALLTRVYLEAFRITESSEYRDTCRSTLDYLLRYMTDAEGGIYSTEDADSEGVEGKFYVWSVSEIRQVLGSDASSRFCKMYDVTKNGNFEGDNILNLRQSFSEFAAANQLNEQELITEMERSRATLQDVRDQRIRPGRDDKVIASWNGMAIEALADAAVCLGDERYSTAALEAGEFVCTQLQNENGRLLHSWRAGEARLAAYLDDYAWMVCACLSCYRIDFEPRWIDRASRLLEDMIEHFYDETDGAFWFTADDHEPLIARTRDWQDGAVPGGNSMAAMACLRMGRLTGNSRLLEIARRTIGSAMPFAHRAPLAVSQMLIAMHSLLHDRHQFILVVEQDFDMNLPAFQELQSRILLESAFIVVRPESTESEPLADVLRGKILVDNQPTLYVCQSSQCAAPISGWTAINSFFEPNGSPTSVS